MIRSKTTFQRWETWVFKTLSRKGHIKKIELCSKEISKRIDNCKGNHWSKLELQEKEITDLKTAQENAIFNQGHGVGGKEKIATKVSQIYEILLNIEWKIFFKVLIGSKVQCNLNPFY